MRIQIVKILMPLLINVKFVDFHILKMIREYVHLKIYIVNFGKQIHVRNVECIILLILKQKDVNF